jgi:2,4-dienoyl-CoA reductase (NADPH2)
MSMNVCTLSATIAASVPRGAFSWVTKKLRDENIVSIPLCATNRINAPSTAESILASGSADLVSMARYVLLSSSSLVFV